MKQLPKDHYNQWPFVRKSLAFLEAAKLLDDPQNRSIDSWEVSYYSLSHSVELIIKGVAQLKTGQEPPREHDKQHLSEMFRKECGFSDDEMETIRQLKELNNGPGGLRYDNQAKGDFLPSTFAEGVQIVERLIEENFQFQ
jgi:HEPN domain-containing protein